MKKLTFTIYALLSFMLIASHSKAQFSGDSFENAQKTKKANLTYIYTESPGFASNNGRTIEGLTTAVMKDFEFYLLDNYDITVNSNYVKEYAQDFAGMLAAVKGSRGGVFGLSNVTITNARKQQYKFSPAYINNIGMMLSHKEVTTLDDISQIASTFSGMTALTVRNTTNEEQLLSIKRKYYPAMKIEYVKSFDEIMSKLVANQNYFSCLDFTYYLNSMKEGMPIKRHAGGETASEEYGIIMPKNSDWDTVFNEFLTDAYKRSSSYRKNIADHLGTNALRLLDAVSGE